MSAVTSVSTVGSNRTTVDLATDEHLRSRGHGVVDPRLHAFGLVAGHQGRDVGGLVERIADDERAHVLDQRCREVVVDRSVREDALRRDARLTRMAESRDLDLRRRAPPVAAGLDHHRRVVAELEADALSRRPLADPPPDRRRAGESDERDVGMVDDCVCRPRHRCRSRPRATLAGGPHSSSSMSASFMAENGV